MRFQHGFQLAPANLAPAEQGAVELARLFRRLARPEVHKRETLELLVSAPAAVQPGLT
jgi:hypothetical protein